MADIKFTSGDINKLVHRFTNSVLNAQALLNCPALEKGYIKRTKRKGVVGNVNIKAGGIDSTGNLADGGTLPTGSSVAPVQAQYNPVIFFSRLSIPRLAAKNVASKEDGIDLVFEEMETVGRDLGRVLGRAIFSSSLGNPATSVTADTDTTFETADPSGFRLGSSIDVYNGSTYIERVIITNVSIPVAGGNATITFEGGGTGGAAANSWTTSYALWLRGSKENGMVSFSDVCADATLYAKSQNSDEWSGNLDSTTTTLTVAKMRRMSTTIKRRRGQKWTCLLLNSINEERYSNMLLANRRFPSGKMDAVGGMAHEFEGRMLVVDENVGDSDIFYHTDEDVQLHEFYDFAPETDGGGSPGMNRNAVIVSDDSYTYDVQIAGAFNLRVLRRNGTGHFSALTQ